MSDYLLKKTFNRSLIAILISILIFSIIFISLRLSGVGSPLEELIKGMENMISKPLYLIIITISFYIILVIYDYKPKLPYTFKKEHKIPENMLLTVSILISLPLYLIFAHNFLNLDNISLFLDNIVNFTISIYLTAFLGFLLYYEIINKSYKEKNRYNHDFLIILSTSFFLVSLFILHNYDYNLNLILLLLVFLNFNIIRRLRYIFIEDNLSRTVQKVLNTSIRVPFIISIILILYNEYTFASYILLYVPLLISIIYMIKR